MANAEVALLLLVIIHFVITAYFQNGNGGHPTEFSGVLGTSICQLVRLLHKYRQAGGIAVGEWKWR